LGRELVCKNLVEQKTQTMGSGEGKSPFANAEKKETWQKPLSRKRTTAQGGAAGGHKSVGTYKACDTTPKKTLKNGVKLN